MQFVPNLSNLNVDLSRQHPNALRLQILPALPTITDTSATTTVDRTAVCVRVYTGCMHMVNASPYMNAASHGLLLCLLPLCGKTLPRVIFFIFISPHIVVLFFSLSPFPFKSAGRQYWRCAKRESTRSSNPAMRCAKLDGFRLSSADQTASQMHWNKNGIKLRPNAVLAGIKVRAVPDEGYDAATQL